MIRQRGSKRRVNFYRVLYITEGFKHVMAIVYDNGRGVPKGVMTVSSYMQHQQTTGDW